MFRPVWILFCCTLAASALASTETRAPNGGLLTILRVGNDGACQFDNLQDAVNAASTLLEDGTIIRVASDLEGQSVTITDRNITLDGRWQNCLSGSPDPSVRRSITGTGSARVITASTAGAVERDLELRGLTLRNGSDASGGGLFVGGGYAASLFDTQVGANLAVRGGGVAVAGENASLLLDEGSIIGAVPSQSLPGNSAVGPVAQGGGLSCTDGATLTINDARIRSNHSDDVGGGIYLSECIANIRPRPEFTDFTGAADGFVTLFENTAETNGGGVFADAGSLLFWGSRPAGSYGGRATGNSANVRGGAFFLQGGSAMLGDWIRIEDSSADDRGGAFAVQGTGTELILRGGPGFRCHGSNCPGIFGTRGLTSGEDATLIGGAVYAEGGATVQLSQIHVYDNYARIGSAAHISGGTSSLELDNALVARNVLYRLNNGTSTIDASSNADVTLRHVTMMGNFRVSGGFPGLELAVASIRANGNASVINIRNSILWNDAQQLVNLLAGASVTGSCVVGHDDTTYPGAAVFDPLYIDTTGNDPDFGLQAGSPAIDRCLVVGGLSEADLYGTPRPQDLPDEPNGIGLFDAGAIEMRGDAIFRDSFESFPLL